MYLQSSNSYFGPMRLSYYYLAAACTVLVLSCKSTKDVLVSEVHTGNFYFHFEQDPKNSDCYYHHFSEDKLVGFIETNFSGDKDDKPPRLLANELKSDLVQKTSPERGTRFEARICMDKQGKVLAIRHDSGQDKELAAAIGKELMKLQYQSTEHRRAECIECKTEYFWLVQ